MDVMQMMPRQVVVGKRCLVYCGDERCDCDAGPLGRGLSLDLGPLGWPLVGLQAFDATAHPAFRAGLPVRVLAAAHGEQDRAYRWDAPNPGAPDPIYAVRVRRRWRDMWDAPTDGTHVRLALTWPEDPGVLVRTEVCYHGDGMKRAPVWHEVGSGLEIDLDPCGWEPV